MPASRALVWAASLAAASILNISNTFAVNPPAITWSAQTTDDNEPAVAPAPGGGVYVGSSNSPGTGILERYSSSGTQLWRISGAKLGYRTDSIGSDAAGNVYVVGEASGSVNGASQGLTDSVLNKFDPNGNLILRAQFGTSQTDWTVGLAVNPIGTSYITATPWGTNYGTPPPGTTTALRQYFADGTAGWINNLDPGDGTFPGAGGSMSHGTCIDTQGNIVSAFTNYTNVANHITFLNYLAKTSPAGQTIWLEPIAAGSNIFGAASDSSNNIYVANGNLSKYDNNGNLLWSIHNGESMFADYVDSTGTIYVAGAGGTAGYVAAYNSAGTQIWSKIINPPAGSTSLTFYSVTESGLQLDLGGQLVNGNTNSGNYFVALAVPEPCNALLAVTGIALMRRARRAATCSSHSAPPPCTPQPASDS